MTPEPREHAKAHQILRGARAVFLAEGFEGASIDAVAREAGVSKATLYNHFQNKEKLFMAVVEMVCAEYAAQLFAVEAEGTTVVDQLRQISFQFPRSLLTSELLEIYRMAVAEAKRFPLVGRAFWDAGPTLSRERLVSLLAKGVAAGELAIDDLGLASEQFVQLCYGNLLLPLVFGVRQQFSDAEIRRNSEAAMRTFLAAYAAPTSP